MKQNADVDFARSNKCICIQGSDNTTYKFESLQNKNYLISLELIAKFDPFLADHISRYGNSVLQEVHNFFTSSTQR
ncbi:hypothetical protein ALC60_10537 [Trachymyrmex zeteki]|uniref:Uncharacterized protein n=1 Tax=Mycetomoellerius zeteki TaxID=64791 RepID=A0A151WRE4_9HYME|nr:hypothetical protein ALC60_10537 [Trachymyrmex zeteki]